MMKNVEKHGVQGTTGQNPRRLFKLMCQKYFSGYKFAFCVLSSPYFGTVAGLKKPIRGSLSSCHEWTPKTSLYLCWVSGRGCEKMWTSEQDKQREGDKQKEKDRQKCRTISPNLRRASDSLSPTAESRKIPKAHVERGGSRDIRF